MIVETLKPRFLPEIQPTEFNYPVDMSGRWRGSKYSFVVRFRSGWPDNAGEEFDEAYPVSTMSRSAWTGSAST